MAATRGSAFTTNKKNMVRSDYILLLLACHDFCFVTKGGRECLNTVHNTALKDEEGCCMGSVYSNCCHCSQDCYALVCHHWQHSSIMSACLHPSHPPTTHTHHRELSGAWFAARSFLSSGWAALYRVSGENDVYMQLVIFPIVTNVVFVLVNSFFAFLDLTGRPAFLVKYKIQEAKALPVSTHSR